MDGISEDEVREFISGDGPIPLPQSASSTAPRHNVAPPSNQTDRSSLPNGLLLPTSTITPTSTTSDVRNPNQTAPSTQTTTSSPSHPYTYQSTIGLSIRLLKPRLNQGGVVTLRRIETHVHLDIKLLSQSWDVIQLPRTKSVTSDDSSSIGEDIKPLLLAITVRGCEKRMGQRLGSPSLLDFHRPSNIVRARDGRVRVHFTFYCYSHHQKEDEPYVLEVILKDVSHPSQPIEVARQELPYSFDVRPQPRQANIGASSKSRRRTKKNTPSVQLPHPKGIKRQTRAGQRTTGHVSSIGELEQQSPSSFGINAQRTSFASDASPQHISDGSIRKGQSYDIPKILGQQIPPPSDLVRLLPSEREVQIRALEMKIRDLGATVDAEGQDEFPLSTDHFNSRILAIQKEMEDHWNAFLAERQKAEAVAVAKVTDFEMQIHALLQWPVS